MPLLKVLVISWFFPPTNTMGALRVGKFVQHLLDTGHDAKVLTVKDPPSPQTFDHAIPQQRIRRTSWADVNWPVDQVSRLLRRDGAAPPIGAPTADGSAGTATPAEAPGRFSFSKLRGLYANLTNVPDSRIGWLPFTVAGAPRLLRGWRPDLVFASAPPFTALLAGYLVHKLHKVPWVAELRDRWSDDPYHPSSGWRLAFDSWLERRVLSSARGLVTVSQPWADTYGRTYRAPSIAIYNGFDPIDYGPGPTSARRDTLSIVYTGRIYPGRRDPSPLFAAMQATRGRVAVRAEFYGARERHVRPLARHYHVEDLVGIHDHVPYRESIRIQQDADVLLLMQWNNPGEQGNVPGKLFEYFGAARPILGLGLEGGVPAQIIRDNDAGIFSNDPAVIAQQLERWAGIKRQTGTIAPLAPEIRAKFTRDKQYGRLTEFLEQLAAG